MKHLDASAAQRWLQGEVTQPEYVAKGTVVHAWAPGEIASVIITCDSCSAERFDPRLLPVQASDPQNTGAHPPPCRCLASRRRQQQRPCLLAASGGANSGQPPRPERHHHQAPSSPPPQQDAAPARRNDYGPTRPDRRHHALPSRDARSPDTSPTGDDRAQASKQLPSSSPQTPPSSPRAPKQPTGTPPPPAGPSSSSREALKPGPSNNARARDARGNGGWRTSQPITRADHRIQPPDLPKPPSSAAGRFFPGKMLLVNRICCSLGLVALREWMLALQHTLVKGNDRCLKLHLFSSRRQDRQACR